MDGTDHSAPCVNSVPDCPHHNSCCTSIQACRVQAASLTRNSFGILSRILTSVLVSFNPHDTQASQLQSTVISLMPAAENIKLEFRGPEVGPNLLCCEPG